MKIIFTNTLDQEKYPLEKPQPADRYIPEWYKDLTSYKNTNKELDEKGDSIGTIKKCIPVFDVITAGYIITSPAELYVDGNHKFYWPNAGLISFHPVWQAPTHPLFNGLQYPKFMNPWAIKTPKGYSTLFVQPFHRPSVFTILPGIVDTDLYTATINFPFVLNDPLFKGFIPKGTPIAQVIPFKRESWTSELGNKKDVDYSLAQREEVRSSFYDYYKRAWHQKKQYK